MKQFLIIVATSFLTVTMLIQASDGNLDSTFGNNGVVVTDIKTIDSLAGSTNVFEGHALALQADGKIILAGFGSGPVSEDFVVARYNTDGTLDSSFGGTGAVVTDIATVLSLPGPSFDRALGVAIQSDQKIVVVGFTNVKDIDGDFAVARYNTNGTLDNSFGGTGVVVTDIASVLSLAGPGDDNAYAVAIQQDGKILVAGLSNAANFGPFDFAVVRYNTDGTLDATFGDAGIVLTDIATVLSLPGLSDDRPNGITVQQDGKIVVVGTTTAAGTADIAVARYNTNGTLDTTFGGTGVVILHISTVLSFGGINGDSAQAVTVQPDGKLVVTGFSNASGPTTFAVIRYNPNGSRDSSFGNSGIVLTDVAAINSLLPGQGSQAYTVALQYDDKIIVTGFVGLGSLNPFQQPKDFVVVRYNTDGSLDTSFGGTGAVVTDLGTIESLPSFIQDEAYGAAIQPDGKIVAGGLIRRPFSMFSPDPQESYFAVARYDNTPPPGPLTVTKVFCGCDVMFGTRDGKRIWIELEDGVITQTDFSSVAVAQTFDVLTPADFEALQATACVQGTPI